MANRKVRFYREERWRQCLRADFPSACAVAASAALNEWFQGATNEKNAEFDAPDFGSTTTRASSSTSGAHDADLVGPSVLVLENVEGLRPSIRPMRGECLPSRERSEVAIIGSSQAMLPLPALAVPNRHAPISFWSS